MSINEFLKKSVAFGLGAAAFSAEKLKQFADEMVARGEMTQDEARRFVDDVSKKADDEKKSMQTWISEQVSKVLQQAGAAEVNRVADLESRVAAIERRIAVMRAEAGMPEAPIGGEPGAPGYPAGTTEAPPPPEAAD